MHVEDEGRLSTTQLGLPSRDTRGFTLVGISLVGAKGETSWQHHSIIYPIDIFSSCTAKSLLMLARLRRHLHRLSQDKHGIQATST
jgi:hypothetical protein